MASRTATLITGAEDDNSRNDRRRARRADSVGFLVRVAFFLRGLMMTKTEFAALCLEMQIDPYVALENESLVAALQARDDQKAIEILANEF